jgi:CheY-like chemotaxis protein
MNRPVTQLLYVDDDRINTLLFVEVCRPDASLAVSTAADAAEALDTARQTPPHALFIDLNLPDSNGLQLLARLRALPGLAAAPAFLCTAERVSEVRDQALAAGFQGVWEKPVDLQTIREALQQALPDA